MEKLQDPVASYPSSSAQFWHRSSHDSQGKRVGRGWFGVGKRTCIGDIQVWPSLAHLGALFKELSQWLRAITTT